MSYLSVAHLEKSFGSTRVLRDVSFDLPEGETLSVIGSSGSGKTTLLRCLNFLERPDAGVISLRDQTLLDGSRPPAPAPEGGSCGKSACISAWCSRISTCFPSTPPWKT